MEQVDFSSIPGTYFIPRIFKTHYPEWYSYLSTKYPGMGLSEALYIEKNGRHVCKICNKPTKYINFNKGYAPYCSSKCSNSDPDKINKTKINNLNKYGVENVSQLESVKSKKVGKCNKGRGVSWTEEVRDKIKQTNLDKYGVEHYSQTTEYKNKVKQTCLERYGVEHHSMRDCERDSKRKQIIEKIKSSNPNIIDCYTGDGSMILKVKCSHPECNKCQEKSYETFSSIYYDRNRYSAEQCTILQPIGGINRNTSIENFVTDVLKEIGINIPDVHEDRKLLAGKGLDFYFEDKKLAIECNGVYYHSAKMKTSRYHYDKFKDCEKQGVQLLTIWEDWIHNKPQIVSSIIKSKFGKYDMRVGARSCQLKEVQSKEVYKFLENNHIQGGIRCSINKGLFYNGELIAVMCFCKKRTNFMGNSKTKDVWELARFCTKLNTQVVGAASRLFNSFLKDYDSVTVESYSSHDISNGRIYEKLGFEKTRQGYGNYWYIENNTFKRYHRSRFCKQELKKMGYDITKTESEIMDDLPYFKIVDSGMSTWIYKK